MLEGSWKQNATTVVASVMSLEVVNNWRSVLQINHLEKDLDMNFILFQQKYVTITIFEWLVSTWHMFVRNFGKKASQIERLFESNSRTFGCFKCSAALCLPVRPCYKATWLQELTECFIPYISPDTRNRTFVKNGSCIQTLDTVLNPIVKIGVQTT